MKRLTILLMIAGSLLLVERAEAGLVWSATATLAVIPRPAAEGVEWVKARGIHRVTVTDMGSFTSLGIKVHAGSLEFNTIGEIVCYGSWVSISSASTVSCTTVVIQEPCEDGIWEAVTIGKVLIASVFKRTKIGLTSPVAVNCACT